jgi:hypothetical protein
MSVSFSKAFIATAALPVPRGTYAAEIIQAEPSTSASGHTSLNLRLRVIEPPEHRGREISDSLMLDSCDAQRLGNLIRRGLVITDQLLDAVEATDSDREKAEKDLMHLHAVLVGQKVRAEIGHMVDKRDGTTKELLLKVSAYADPAATVLG